MALKVWLPLDGNLENKGLDNRIFTNKNSTNVTIDNNGKIGKCYQKSTKMTTGYIEDNKTINLDNDLTMCCWAYPIETVTSDTANGLVTNHDHNQKTGVGINIKTISSTDYRISCSTGTGTSRTYNTYYGTTNIKGAWHHLALTYCKADEILQLWVDGKLEYTLNNYINASTDSHIRLFAWSVVYDGSEHMPAAKLNDVRIYDECLSSKQIKEISKGLICHYKFEGVGARENLLSESKLSAGTLAQKTTETLFGLPVYKGVYTSGTYLDTYSINSFIAPTGDTYYTGSFWAKGTGGMTCYFYPNVVTSGINSQGRTTTSADGNITFTLTSGWQKYWVTWKTSSSISGNKNLIFGRITSGEAYISNPKLELGQEVSDWIPNINDKLYTDLGYDKMMLKDFSGYGHDLTQVGTQSTLDIDSPRYRANVMNNNNDYFYYNGFNINGDSTFSAWFKIKAWKSSGDASSYIYHLGYGTSTTQHCIWVISNSIKLFANGTQINPSYNFSLNTWYHVVTTISGTTANIYINGVNIKTATCNAPVTCNLLTVMNRSANSTPGSDGGYKANGNISDLRFYATALSDAGVKELYQTSAFIDNKNNMFAYEFVEE